MDHSLAQKKVMLSTAHAIPGRPPGEGETGRSGRSGRFEVFRDPHPLTPSDLPDLLFVSPQSADLRVN
jgi:hypothetical protein